MTSSIEIVYQEANSIEISNASGASVSITQELPITLDIAIASIGPKGDTGNTGPANVLSIGTVSSGESASATITGTTPSQTLNLILPKGDTGATGAGVAAGGVIGQYLKKNSTTDYDTSWDTLATVATSGAYDDLSGTPSFATVATTGAYSDLTGKPTLGTISPQNANSVAITGGAINGTMIGSTTPAAATFTTLTATGQTNLGGSSTAPSFRATVGDNAPNTMWIEAKGASSIDAAVYLGVGGTSAKPLLIVNQAQPISFRTTTIGGTSAEQFRVSHTASAVNYVQVTGAATGGGVVLSSQGSDASPPMYYSAKGFSSHRFYTNGGTTDEQFRIYNTTTSRNYIQVTGATVGNSPKFESAGSDTNISMAFQPKGTGAIDLAAGSSGVNISNGGTITAITRTAAGSNYTSMPTMAISAPTTAGGVQAVATPYMAIQAGPTLASGGSGYSANDVLSISGATGTLGQITVNTVTAGVITTFTLTAGGAMSAIPSATAPVSFTGGTGTGATFNIVYQISSSGALITTAGSGYVEQPTVTFSGGGGSGAAAYATVGSGTQIKSLGSTLDFYTPNAGIGLRVEDTGGTGTAYWRFRAGNNNSQMLATATAVISSTGSNPVSFYTNGLGNLQMSVAHTASAVNYVQVTGAATGAAPAISPQGSDTNVHLDLQSKGSGQIRLAPLGTARVTVQNTNGQCDFSITNGVPALRTTSTSNQVNYLSTTGSISGAGSLALTANGTDTNIDLALTPKGTGLVRFGTLTATADTAISGYITIKDSGGTTRKLAVIT